MSLTASPLLPPYRPRFRQAWAVVLVVTALRAVSRSMPVVSAMICAISGMQAVLPSVMGNSSTRRMGSGGTSLAADEAGAPESGCGKTDVLADDAGASVLPQAESSRAEEAAPRPNRKLRRVILTFFIRKSSLRSSSCPSRQRWKQRCFRHRATGRKGPSSRSQSP